MTLENALRLQAAIVPDLRACEAGSDTHLRLRLALTLVEEELMALGWRNEPEDVPAMEAASRWVAEQTG